MEPLMFFAVLYGSSVLFAAFMTVREQRHMAVPGEGYSRAGFPAGFPRAGFLVIGILACLIWPLVAIVCILSGPSQLGHGA